jgi:hypothetical protein
VTNNGRLLDTVDAQQEEAMEVFATAKDSKAAAILAPTESVSITSASTRSKVYYSRKYCFKRSIFRVVTQFEI